MHDMRHAPHLVHGVAEIQRRYHIFHNPRSPLLRAASGESRERRHHATRATNSVVAMGRGRGRGDSKRGRGGRGGHSGSARSSTGIYGDGGKLFYHQTR